MKTKNVLNESNRNHDCKQIFLIVLITLRQLFNLSIIWNFFHFYDAHSLSTLFARSSLYCNVVHYIRDYGREENNTTVYRHIHYSIIAHRKYSPLLAPQWSSHMLSCGRPAVSVKRYLLFYDSIWTWNFPRKTNSILLWCLLIIQTFIQILMQTKNHILTCQKQKIFNISEIKKLKVKTSWISNRYKNQLWDSIIYLIINVIPRKIICSRCKTHLFAMWNNFVYFLLHK